MSKRLLLFLLIVSVAVFFRLYHLSETPPGLFFDEAVEGNDASLALESDNFSVFYPDNNGREGLLVALEATSIKFLGHTAMALRIVSAIIGILTVIGLYLLVKQIFQWQIATFTGILFASSFWHVMFSRIGFRAILAPFCLVWGSYFLWKALQRGHKFDFAIAGFFWALGFYTYISFRIMPMIVLITLFGYWQFIKDHFNHESYIHARTRLISGIGMFMIVFAIVSLPIFNYFYNNPGDFWGRIDQLSIFKSDHPFSLLAMNTARTIGMFFISGDMNWRHNISGEALLILPLAVLFAIGFVRNYFNIIRRRNGRWHFSAIHLFLLLWFVVGLIPAIISNESIPHALRALQVVPVVYIFIGEAMWWLYDHIRKWYYLRDPHQFKTAHHMYFRESSLVATLVIVVLSGAIVVTDYHRYFEIWAHEPKVAAAFKEDDFAIVARIQDTPNRIKKYIVVESTGILVNNIPIQAQTIMYLTDTATQSKQKLRNIEYVTPAQFKRIRPKAQDIVIHLK